MAQALINAQHQVNLATLPAFSNNEKEDKYTAAQWLQKVLLHRQAAAWNDEQIITHVRNALKDRVIDWFDSLPALGVSQQVWAEVQARFEIDYKAKATATSIVAKLPEVKQAADENVNDYFSRANKILWELKENINPADLEIPNVVLPNAIAEQWTGLDQEVRDFVVNHVRLHASARTCENYNAMILTAGFKPSIKTKILGAGLIVLADIKNLALKTETLELEKKAKTNGFPINPVEETEDEVDAVKFGNNRGGYGRNFRGGPSQFRGGGRGANNYQPRGGQESSRGGYGGYNTGRGGQNQNQPAQTQPQRGAFNGQRGNYTQPANQSNGGQNTSKWCANCRKPTHNTAQCWTKKKINPVEGEEQQDLQGENNQEGGDEINAFYESKN